MRKRILLCITVLSFVISALICCANSPSALESGFGEDITGVWSLGGKAIIKIDKNSNNELTALYYDTRPSSQIWFDLKDIKYEDGILSCNFPDFAGNRSTYEGRLSEDKKQIMDLTRENSPIAQRVENPETVSLMENIQSSVKRGTSRKYRYTLPENVDDGWEIDALEKVGMDRNKINDMIDQIFKGTYGDIHDVLIVKNKKLVLEEYFRGEGKIYGQYIENLFRNKQHHWGSATKSILSIIVGIAIQEGYIRNVDEPVYNFFPKYENLRNERKDRILLKHLLTMSAGLQWKSPDDVNGMWRTDDIIRYCLEKPVVAEPGEQFNYSNGWSTLLGAVVSNASGMNFEEFSRKFLFSPLGTTDIWFQIYPEGTTDTDGGLYMRPRDFTKIGLLLMKNGVWNGKQIISRDWIKESTRGYIRSSESSRYGYQWWCREFKVNDTMINAYHASGYGGNYMFIFPELDLLVVFNAEIFDKSVAYYRDLLEKYILPAAGLRLVDRGDDVI